MTTGERESYWREIVGRLEESGQSVQTFCREQGISAHSLYIWRKRFRKGERMDFAVVEVRPEPPAASAGLEVRFSTGERLQVPAGVDVATLRSVIAILRERA